MKNKYNKSIIKYLIFNFYLDLILIFFPIVVMAIAVIIVPNLSWYTIYKIFGYRVTHESSVFLKIFSTLLHLGMPSIISFQIRSKVKTVNKYKTFLEEKSNSYVDIHFLYIKIAFSFLGYRKIRTSNMSVPLQYKLYLTSAFSSYDSLNYRHIENERIEVTITHDRYNNKELNLELSDTGIIESSMLSSLEKTDCLVHIKRENIGNYYSESFIDNIENIIEKYKKYFEVINLYAFTNSKHNEEIVKRCFNYKEIGKIKELNIYYYDPEIKEFSTSKVTIPY